MKKVIIVVIGLAVVLWIMEQFATKEVASGVNTTATNLTQVQKDSIESAEIEKRKNQTVTASEITQDYIDNEVRADDTYKGKTFYVEGTVSDIKKDIMGDIYVTLSGSEIFREVQCYFDNSSIASSIEKGMRVTFLGKCDGLMMNVLMKDCKLVDNIKDSKKQKK